MKIPRLESLIILVFFGCVALWGISKCAGRRAELGPGASHSAGDDADQEDRPMRRDTVFVPQKPAPATHAAPTQTPTALPPGTVAPNQPARPAGTPTPQPSPAVKPGPPAASGPQYSTLYATIDGLKVRKEPNLKAAVVAKLELYEAVSFLNQKTEKVEEISLGYEKVTDHWVKIRTKDGKVGWVFGAGVHYYKMKRKGVME